jgi:2'-5' RNA ligase
VQRLRALAASDAAEFRREAHERFDTAASKEQFAWLRVALACDAPLADELGRALLDQGRRDDDERFAAAVTLLQKQADRSNEAARSLLATLTAEEAQRFAGRGRGESEPADAR